mmetsp:Transcript_115507/g.358907  ORF Transcript_115507/g.358907 Transcript_115507/m.358907 type:complete len:80 (+) Transcript_115507:2284-2523(+)
MLGVRGVQISPELPALLTGVFGDCSPATVPLDIDRLVVFWLSTPASPPAAEATLREGLKRSPVLPRACHRISLALAPTL